LPGLFGGGKRPYLQVAATVSREDLEKLAELAREGKLRVLVENPVPMENALMAYERRRHNFFIIKNSIDY